MITATSLKSYTAKDLAQMAKKRGVPGWHSMRKDDLIRALVASDARKNGKKNGKNAASGGTKTTAERRRATTPKRVDSATRSRVKSPHKKPVTPRRIRRAQEKQERLKDISATNGTNGHAKPTSKDRVVLMVRDPYWVHAYWEITSQAINRARAAMAELWHTAKPVLRLLEVRAGGMTTDAETVIRDIEIHGGVKNWYIDVPDPPKTYRVEIGYLGSGGKFYGLSRSNAVSTPRPSSSDMVDQNWADVADNCEKIFAMSGGYSRDGGRNGELQELLEERLRRPMGSPMVTKFGLGAEASLERDRQFSFELDAEMIVFGVTQPDAHVTMGGEPIKLRPDGTFTVRISMPEGRQVLPVVSGSADGLEQQTIVLAVERNTKTMEPLVRDASG